MDRGICVLELVLGRKFGKHLSVSMFADISLDQDFVVTLTLHEHVRQ